MIPGRQRLPTDLETQTYWIDPKARTQKINHNRSSDQSPRWWVTGRACHSQVIKRAQTLELHMMEGSPNWVSTFHWDKMCWLSKLKSVSHKTFQTDLLSAIRFGIAFAFGICCVTHPPYFSGGARGRHPLAFDLTSFVTVLCPVGVCALALRSA